MDELFMEFKNLILNSESQAQETSLEQERFICNLRSIYAGLRKCGHKLSSASKFIDFFVHDILDYTILNKEALNFKK